MRPYTDIFGQVDRGLLAEKATAELAELTAAVVTTRKAGSITVTLTIKPNGENSVIVTAKTATKIPQAPLGESLFFTLSDGSLVRDDPKQEKLDLRVVDQARGA